MKRFINHLMPGFFDKMPPKKAGRFVASVESYNFRRSETVWRKEFNGLRRAYFAARLKALWWDWMSPEWRGIAWHVTGDKKP